MQIGMIGLGRMGSNMVQRLLKHGHECVVFDARPESVAGLQRMGAEGSGSLVDFVSKLQRPRAIWLMLPAAIVDQELAQLTPLLSEGDIVIDGGNSFYHDDMRRAGELKSKGIHYVDVGTSGGVFGLERGYCLMIGGEKEMVEASCRRSSPRWHRATAGSRAPPRTAASAGQAPPSKVFCIADRTAPAISSRWFTTASNTD